MCIFCGTEEERKMAEQGAERLARDLKKLAAHYEALARGLIKPHTEEIKKDQSLANSIIRRLVEDWI
jgi:hypothetical protein